MRDDTKHNGGGIIVPLPFRKQQGGEHLANGFPKVRKSRAGSTLQRFEMLSDFAGRLLAGDDAYHVALPALYDQLSSDSAFDICLIFSLDEACGHLKMVSHHGFDPRCYPGLMQLDLGDGISGQVAATRQPAHITNIKQRNCEREARLRSAALRAFACEPLIVADKLIGTIGFGSRQYDAFCDEDLKFIRAVARQMSLAHQSASARAALIDREERLTLALEGGGLGAWEIDFATGQALWSEKTAEHLGVKPGFYDREAREALIFPEDLPAYRAAVADAHISGVFNHTWRTVWPDGTLRWIEAQARVHYDSAGKSLSAFGVSRDVTRSKQIEQQLRMSEGLSRARQAELETLYATAPIGLGVLDSDLRFYRINERLAEMNGMSVADHLGRRVDELLPDLAPQALPILQRIIETGEPVLDVEITGETPARPGVLRSWRENWLPIFNIEDQVIGISISADETTERKAAELALKASEARLRAVLESMPALVFVGDGYHNTYVNQRFIDFTGRPAEALLGDRWRDIVHPDDLPRKREIPMTVEAATVEREVKIRAADGSWRTMLLRSVIIEDHPGRTPMVLGTMADVQLLVDTRTQLSQLVDIRTNDLKRANARLAAEMQQREAAQAALLQSQKLEALGQVTAGIAHDFNNVVAAIASGFSVIERRTDDPRVLEITHHGRKAAERGAAIVQQLLAFARRQQLSPKAVDVSDLLDQALPLISRSTGPHVEVTVDCADDLPQVRVDLAMLESALLNLAINARDAMDEDGTLTIRARPCPPSEPGRPEEMRGVDAVAISIADTGCGIAPETLDRVIEPFFTTKPVGKGTGLGLAMVHGFLMQSGGALRIASVLGEGTTVTIYLPCHDALDRVAAVQPPAAALNQRLSPTSILLVDDDNALRAITAALLQDLGHRVTEANGTEAAMALAGDLHFELLITDIVMAGADGLELAQYLRDLRPDLAVVFITGQPRPDMPPGEIVVTKPFQTEALLAACTRAMTRTQTWAA